MTSLAPTGGYFGEPLDHSDAKITWVYRDYNPIALSVAGITAVAAVVSLVVAIVGTSLDTRNPLPLVIALVLPLFLLAFTRWFLLLGYNEYVIDAQGFTTRGPFNSRKRVVPADTIRRVGVALTGPALVAATAGLEPLETVKREQVLAAVSKSYRKPLDKPESGYLVVVETYSIEVTGVLIKRADAASLVAALATLEPRERLDA